MQSKPAKEHFIDLAKDSIDGDPTKGREDCQEGWHRLVASLLLGTVLDVGAGLGLSKGRIPYCVTQEVHPGLPADLPIPVEDILSKSFDTVTAFDVIEHVVEDVTFLADLCRIARRWVFLTTPNLDVSKAANGCHCREYSPAEFVALTEGLGRRTFWHGDGNGFSRLQVSLPTFLAHTAPHHAVLIDLNPGVGQ